MKVIKRDGSVVNYDNCKIKNALLKANETVSFEKKVSKEQIETIIQFVESHFKEQVSVEEIQDTIEKKLMCMGKYDLAKKYITYRYVRDLVRKENSTDESILNLVRFKNRELAEENSNKNASIASTQRDLIAGEVSKDLSRRLLLPEKISKAHDNGVLHFHDLDYFLQPIFNCCLINIGDMLDHGTVMNGKMIESPKSFQVACTVTTQIIAAVASCQYGGQSVEMSHLGKYLRKSYDKFMKKMEIFKGKISDEDIEKIVKERVRSELESGVQTIQYQINTLMTTNGQSPFVTLFLNLKGDDPYIEENAMIIEEILRQRYMGIKNEKGVYITPAFPKLIYVLDEHNCLKGGKYDYLTKLAVKCSSKRLYPDYISAKKMRENYEGNVFSPMGCRSFLSPYKDERGIYKFEGRFNQGVVSINLPQIAILADKDEERFFQLFEERLELCKEALLCRHKALMGVSSDISPIHFQYGAIARLDKGEKIDALLKDGYSTLSLGYIGLYETTKLMTGKEQTEQTVGLPFALRIMHYMNEKCKQWKKETGLGFALYGTPAESLCYRFARIDQEKFGIIPDVTDKGYYTNSYHVDVRQKIDAFSKLSFESQFQSISSGGAISYIEIPNMRHNLEALESLVTFIYDNIQYAEFNTKSDYCHVCGFDGEILINEDLAWECPVCGNKDHKRMNVTRRTCGYLGENFWNVGKTKEIAKRTLHL